MRQVEIHLNGDPVEELSFICHSSKATALSRQTCLKLLDIVPRQQFLVIIIFFFKFNEVLLSRFFSLSHFETSICRYLSKLMNFITSFINVWIILLFGMFTGSYPG